LVRACRATYPLAWRLPLSQQISLFAVRLRRAAIRIHPGDARRGVLLLAQLAPLLQREHESARWGLRRLLRRLLHRFEHVEDPQNVEAVEPGFLLDLAGSEVLLSAESTLHRLDRATSDQIEVAGERTGKRDQDEICVRRQDVIGRPQAVNLAHELRIEELR